MFQEPVMQNGHLMIGGAGQGLLPMNKAIAEFQNAVGPIPGLGDDAIELYKTLTAGAYQTDIASLQGGEALRFESLDSTLKAITVEQKHFRFWKNLARHNATAIIDQWIEKPQDAIARFPGSGFNSETGDIAEHNANYTRKFDEVKYLMTMRRISVVLQNQQNVINVDADESYNAGLELIQSAEWANFYGDKAVVPVEYDGLDAALTSRAPDNIRDMESSSDVTELYGQITDLSGFVAEHGNFGELTHMYHGLPVQTDLDNFLLAGYRVQIAGNAKSIEIGSPVNAIRSSHGDITMEKDVITGLRARQMPQEATSSHETDTSKLDTAGTVTITIPGSAAGSKFRAAHAGEYWYGVASVNKFGEAAIKWGDTSVTVAVGEEIKLSIAESSAANETGYAIYRSQMDVDPGVDETLVRFVRRIAKTSTPTVFLDWNLYHPGSEDIFLVNHAPASQAISQAVMTSLSRFRLYPTVSLVYPFAYFMFCYLRITKPVQHAMIRNFLPTKATWRPFG